MFNKDDEQVVAILKGHSKKVNRVIYHPSGENNVITASYDATIRIWDVPTSQVKQITSFSMQILEQRYNISKLNGVSNDIIEVLCLYLILIS